MEEWRWWKMRVLWCVCVCIHSHMIYFDCELIVPSSEDALKIYQDQWICHAWMPRHTCVKWYAHGASSFWDGLNPHTP